MAAKDASNAEQLTPWIGGSRPVPDPTDLTNELVEKATTALREILEARIDANEQRIVDSKVTIDRHVDISINTLKESLGAHMSTVEQRFAQVAATTEKAALDVRIAVDTAFESARTIFDEKIRALTETVAVFKTAVNERFQLGDVQTEKAARDVKSAVDAAFAAAKEAVGEQNKSNALSIAKSEVATTKQIDQLTANLQASVKNTDDKIDALKKTSDDKFNDLKDRLVAMESRSSVTDPGTNLALRDMANAIGSLRTASSIGAGEKKGATESVGLVLGIIGSVGLVIGVFIALAAYLHH